MRGVEVWGFRGNFWVGMGGIRGRGGGGGVQILGSLGGEGLKGSNLYRILYRYST